MRSVTRAAVLAALALAGCGDYSTEDLRFLAALPQREDLKVEVPADAEAAAVAVAKGTAVAQGPTAACGLGSADVWLWAKPTSDGLNAGVEFVVGLVDVVRRAPPTWRQEDARGWGPFDDENHPGREIQIGIARTYPEELGGAPRHLYAFQARVKGTQEFTTIIFGAFDGGSAAHGSGWVALYFDALWALGMNDATSPHGTMQIAYDRSGDPVTIQLWLAQGGFGNEAFGYRFGGYADGSGVFDYAFRDGAANLLVVSTGYDAVGAGRAHVAFAPAGGGPVGQFDQCWDEGACLVRVDDPGNYSCVPAEWGGACTRGDAALCASIPPSPF
jgi:hypothetical protein